MKKIRRNNENVFVDVNLSKDQWSALQNLIEEVIFDDELSEEEYWTIPLYYHIRNKKLTVNNINRLIVLLNEEDSDMYNEIKNKLISALEKARNDKYRC